MRVCVALLLAYSAAIYWLSTTRATSAKNVVYELSVTLVHFFLFAFVFFLLLSVLTCKCFMITIVVVNFTSIIVVFSSDCSVCINNDD